MKHRFDLKVYYEDTDMAGIVYYANYLKFIERARSTWVEELGIDQLALRDSGVVFAVRDISAQYFVPALMGDSLQVQSRVIATTAARWVLEQVVERGGVSLFTAVVTVVALDDNGSPRRLPVELR